MKAIARMRRLHRFLGVTFACFFANSVVTGLLWAYAPFLYWERGYMEKKAAISSPALTAVMVTVREVIGITWGALGHEVTITSIALRSDFGKILYEVRYRKRGVDGTILIDGLTKDVLSPLPEATTVAIAMQYVRDAPAIESVVLLNEYVSRSGGKPVSAFRVRFRQPGAPEIFIDRNSGQIIEDQDRARRVHFFIMQLHQLNFFGFRKTLTIIPGLSLLAMIGTGVVLWIGPRIRSRARRRREDCTRWQ